MIHCIGIQASLSAKPTTVYAFSSLKRREAKAAKVAAPFIKFAVPTMDDVTGMWKPDGFRLCKPMRRSIVWVDEGIRLRAELSYVE